MHTEGHARVNCFVYVLCGISVFLVGSIVCKELLQVLAVGSQGATATSFGGP